MVEVFRDFDVKEFVLVEIHVKDDFGDFVEVKFDVENVLLREDGDSLNEFNELMND